MKKLILLLSLMPSLALGLALPSHFGSEISVIGTGTFYQGALQEVEVNLQFTSSKLFKNKLYVSTIGKLKKEDKSGLGISAFLRLNPNLFIGGSVLSDNSFHLSENIVLLASFPYRNGLLEPFISVDIDGSFIANLGLRAFVSDVASVIFCINNLQDYVNPNTAYDVSVGLSFPIKDFEFLENLLPKALRVKSHNDSLNPVPEPSS